MIPKRPKFSYHLVQLHLLTEEAGKDLELSLNRECSDERALFVRCDISNQDDVQVSMEWGYFFSKSGGDELNKLIAFVQIPIRMFVYLYL